MNPDGFIHAKLKRVNQILKERGPRGGEAWEQLTAGTAKIRTGKKAAAREAETTGETTQDETCEVEPTDDWPIILHNRLWDFAWWQHFIPSIAPMSQDLTWDRLAWDEAWQRPQGVKATTTPRTNKPRLSHSIVFRMS